MRKHFTINKFKNCIFRCPCGKFNRKIGEKSKFYILREHLNTCDSSVNIENIFEYVLSNIGKKSF
jgi:hypothetical protein